MTNAKISPKARAILRNRPLSSAIAMALVENSHTLARKNVIVTISDNNYIIKISSSLTVQTKKGK